MVDNIKKAKIIQIVLYLVFGINLEMTDEEKELHKKFLAYHIEDFYNDLEKVLVTLDRDFRMLLEKLLIEFKKQDVLMEDFNITKEQLINGLNNTFMRLRNPKRSKYLLKYVCDSWKEYIDKDFD